MYGTNFIFYFLYFSFLNTRTDQLFCTECWRDNGKMEGVVFDAKTLVVNHW